MLNVLMVVNTNNSAMVTNFTPIASKGKKYLRYSANTNPTTTKKVSSSNKDDVDVNKLLNSNTNMGWTSKMQDNTKGISSIFNPQIIIKDDGKETGVYYNDGKSGGEDIKMASYDRHRNRYRRYNNNPRSNDSRDGASYSDSLSTQEPTHDLWEDEQDGIGGIVLGDPYQYYSTPRKDSNLSPSQQLAINSYNILPPSCNWDVPQQRPPVCITNNAIDNPIGVGNFAPLVNMLELNPDGTQSTSESRVKFTNVGSLLPKFDFKETEYN